MTNTQANDAFDDELLSAYVDGELSDEQIAQVEQRLSEDSAARGLVGELQALSETLRAMPRETVGEDLRGAVLRQAELLPVESRGTGGVRRWGWALMALAAMLLLMVFQPGEEREGQPLASVDVEREKAVVAKSQQVPALRAPMVASVEAEEEAASESLDVLAEGVVAKPQQEVASVQKVHLVLADDGGEFDRLLFSNGLVRVDQSQIATEKSMERSRRMNLGDRQPESLAREKEALQVVEVLAEGTAEQIKKMLFACLADQRRYSELLVEEESEGIDLYSESSPQSGVVAFGRALENKFLLGDQLDDRSDDLSGVGGKMKQDGAERVQVLFLLHQAPQVAKPAGIKED